MANLAFYFSALILSLYSRRFYAHIVKFPVKPAMKYLLLLSLLVALPLAMEAKSMVDRLSRAGQVDVEKDLEHIRKQLPEIYIKDSKFAFSIENNLAVNSLTGDIVAIFDIEGLITDLSTYPGVAIVNKNDLKILIPETDEVMVIKPEEVRNSQYFQISDGVRKLNTKEFFVFLKNVMSIPFLMIYLVAILWILARYTISSLAYSFIVGVFLSMMAKENSFDFRQCFRVAAFTLTPVAILEMTSNYLGHPLFSYVTLVYFVTHILYIHFAVESYRRYFYQKNKVHIL